MENCANCHLAFNSKELRIPTRDKKVVHIHCESEYYHKLIAQGKLNITPKTIKRSLRKAVHQAL